MEKELDSKYPKEEEDGTEVEIGITIIRLYQNYSVLLSGGRGGGRDGGGRDGGRGRSRSRSRGRGGGGGGGRSKPHRTRFTLEIENLSSRVK